MNSDTSASTDRGLPGFLFRRLVDTIDSAVRSATRVDAFQRDPAFVARLQPIIRAINRYFGTDVRGWENVPKRGPFLVVGNHSGGAITNDLYFFMGAWLKDRGPEAPLYALGYDMLFGMPVLGTMMRRFGIVPGNQVNARKALDLGAAVVVFPGGDYEVFRPWTERNRIDFGGRTGFIELAISTGVPVVPMTIHGAHESTIVLTRGRGLAHWMGFDRFNVKVFPFVWNIPLGLTPAAVPSVHLPARVTVQFGKPLRWSRYGPDRASDPVVLKKCYAEITGLMQETLDQLVREDPFPILSRLNQLRPSHLLPSLIKATPQIRKRRGAKHRRRPRPRRGSGDGQVAGHSRRRS